MVIYLLLLRRRRVLAARMRVRVTLWVTLWRVTLWSPIRRSRSGRNILKVDSRSLLVNISELLICPRFHGQKKFHHWLIFEKLKFDLPFGTK